MLVGECRIVVQNLAHQVRVVSAVGRESPIAPCFSRDSASVVNAGVTVGACGDAASATDLEEHPECVDRSRWQEALQAGDRVSLDDPDVVESLACEAAQHSRMAGR